MNEEIVKAYIVENGDCYYETENCKYTVRDCNLLYDEQGKWLGIVIDTITDKEQISKLIVDSLGQKSYYESETGNHTCSIKELEDRNHLLEEECKRLHEKSTLLLRYKDTVYFLSNLLNSMIEESCKDINHITNPMRFIQQQGYIDALRNVNIYLEKEMDALMTEEIKGNSESLNSKE